MECSVIVTMLDSYRLKPGVVKIDTEGNEYSVLQGALETLKNGPRIVLETHSPESLQIIRNYLEARGYSIMEVRRTNRFNQVQSWLICN
jgi:precorrin-6B methylase 2